MSSNNDGGLSVGNFKAAEEFTEALCTYAAGLTANFAALIEAQPEDQLKAPVGDLLKAAGKAAGMSVLYRTETRVDGVAGRPDLGIDSDGLPVGNIELKQPGKGARPEAFSDKHSKSQFERFKKLPNLLYTDGREWSLYRSGERHGDVVSLPFDPTSADPGDVTSDVASPLLELLGVFLGWEPVVPSTPRALADMLAPLTRVLRDEVLADVKAEGVMAQLAAEWRNTLFPDADDLTFADGYAQTFTYALLLARLEGAEPPLDADAAAKELDDDHALLAQALRILGQAETREAIGMPVGLLERVIGAVDATKLAAGKDPWLYFYEDFLAAYDPAQRNNRGVYYTPFDIVDAQVRLCHRLLVDRMDMPKGFGDLGVVALDPAAGTGTYPLTIAARVLNDAVAQGGEGLRSEVATQLVRNLNAFELLVGPYAVTHLRLSRMFTDAGAALPDDGVNVFLTDTLAAPADEGFAKQTTLFQQRLAVEQERASKVKAPDTQVTVIIGNPPYDRDESQSSSGQRRKGGMVRYDGDSKQPGLIRDFIEPLTAADAGVNAHSLYNDYAYFWRWAIWKACEQHDDPAIVSFITASSYLTGPGFAGMREVMRRQFDEIWMIDLGGEGRGARKEANVFDGVLSPVAIAFAIRVPDVDKQSRLESPATIRYRRISGTRDEKLGALAGIQSLDAQEDWELTEDGWGASFIPKGVGPFASWPAIDQLLPWRDTGTHFYRSWPIGESKEVLIERWKRLTSAPPVDRAALLKESRDRKAAKAYRDIFTKDPLTPVDALTPAAEAPTPRRLGFRSFDRHWCLPDNRIGDYIRAQLWRVASPDQLYLQTLVQSPMSNGPALVAFADVPDCHAFRGSYGDKGIFPLWRDAQATTPNITAGLLGVLGDSYGYDVAAGDIAAYLYGLMGTSEYTRRFHDELGTSEARVPITASPDLFNEVVAFGRDLLWWATYAERFRPIDNVGSLVKTLPPGTAKNTKAVPTGKDKYPSEFSFDQDTRVVRVGEGEFGPVAPLVWNFEVSGLKVVQSWLDYRMKVRAGKKSSDLDNIRPATWQFSAEFVALLAIIEHLVEAESTAADLLERVTSGLLIDPSVLPMPTEAEAKPPSAAAAKTRGQLPHI